MIDRALRHVACVIKWAVIVVLTMLGVSLLAGAVWGWWYVYTYGEDPLKVCTGPLTCMATGGGLILSVLLVVILIIGFISWCFENSSC